MFILMFSIITNVGVTTHTAEYSNQRACEIAADWHAKQMQEKPFRSVIIVATCTKKD